MVKAVLRQHRGRLIVNPGSVGMQYVAGAPPKVLPYAAYASVESNKAN